MQYLDGVAQPGELLTLAQAGVQSLNLSHTTSTTVDANGNAHKQVGTYTRTDGTSRAMNDVWFDQDTARTARVRCSKRRLKTRANKALYTSGKAIFHQKL